jgi:hypothetical protein
VDLNKNFAELSDTDLTEYRSEVISAFDALVKEESPTDEQVAQAEEYAEHIKAVDTLRAERATAAAAKAERLSNLRNLDFSESEPEEGDEEEDEEESDEADDEAEEAEDAEEGAPVAEVPEPVQAAAKNVKTLARKVRRPKAPARSGGKVKITAAADVQGFATGQNLDSLTNVAQAVINRAKGFAPPSGDGRSENIQQFGTAMLNIDFPDELIVDRFDDAQEAIDYATRESRLPGGSLTAAGGWCAPSETVYDLDMDATTDGMLSLPEIGVRRGGIRFAQSPNFADYYANPGFIQTEAQAIAGTAKTCIEVDCPDFTEVRLDAEGICIKVPILTNAAYPEYVRTFVSGSLVAHQHWINANVIGRIVTAAGAARVITGLGSTVSDTLEGLELLAEQTRQKYRLGLNSSLEVVVPFWVRAAVKADLRRRSGQLTPVSDAQVQQHFAAANLNVQFVYDWQALDETAEVYPATFNALMYPAGTFVKGVAPVINLNTIYDAASLVENVYTGLFTEQGLLVAKKKFHADLVTLPLCNAGRVGAADLTCEVAP